MELLLQTPGTPIIYEALARLAKDDGFARLRIAVAFATKPGVLLLQQALEGRSTPIEVLAVVGLDRSMTEPEALSMLESDERVELRVFRSPANTMLHAKAYFFDGQSGSSILLGSCNLSAAALTRNREAAVVLTDPGEPDAFNSWEQWWESIWTAGQPWTGEIVDEYASQYSPSYSSPSDSQDVGKAEELTVKVGDADRLWLGTAYVTGGGGTQLELPKETVGFFLDPAAGAGGMELRLVGGSQVWEGNVITFYSANDMWRINLSGEIPEVADKSLSYKFVLFRRTEAAHTFEFGVVEDDEIEELRSASQALGQYGETSSRDFGWL